MLSCKGEACDVLSHSLCFLHQSATEYYNCVFTSRKKCVPNFLYNQCLNKKENS